MLLRGSQKKNHFGRESGKVVRTLRRRGVLGERVESQGEEKERAKNHGTEQRHKVDYGTDPSVALWSERHLTFGSLSIQGALGSPDYHIRTITIPRDDYRC